MRSIVEGDIMLLPQWSDPILVSLDVLTPPNITNSQLLSLKLTTNSPTDFLMETSIELSWTEPEGGSEGLLFYEVWIGSIALEEYEEPENLRDEVNGAVISCPYAKAHPNTCTCTIYMYIIAERISARF